MRGLLGRPKRWPAIKLLSGLKYDLYQRFARYQSVPKRSHMKANIIPAVGRDQGLSVDDLEHCILLIDGAARLKKTILSRIDGAAGLKKATLSLFDGAAGFEESYFIPVRCARARACAIALRCIHRHSTNSKPKNQTVMARFLRMFDAQF